MSFFKKLAKRKKAEENPTDAFGSKQNSTQPCHEQTRNQIRCPHCGATYSTDVVMAALIAHNGPTIADFATWQSSVKCANCRQSIPVSGSYKKVSNI